MKRLSIGLTALSIGFMLGCNGSSGGSNGSASKAVAPSTSSSTTKTGTTVPTGTTKPGGTTVATNPTRTGGTVTGGTTVATGGTTVKTPPVLPGTGAGTLPGTGTSTPPSSTTTTPPPVTTRTGGSGTTPVSRGSSGVSVGKSTTGTLQITVQPSSGAVGAQITVQLAGLLSPTQAPYAGVTLLNSQGSPVQIPTQGPDPTVSNQWDFTIPSTPAGAYSVVFQEVDPTQTQVLDQASAAFTVTSGGSTTPPTTTTTTPPTTTTTTPPTTAGSTTGQSTTGNLYITVTPGSGNVGDTIAVQMTGLDPNTQQAWVQLMDSSGTPIQVTNLTVNQQTTTFPTGNMVEMDFNVPSTPSGAYVVDAQIFDGTGTPLDDAQAPFTIGSSSSGSGSGTTSGSGSSNPYLVQDLNAASQALANSDPQLSGYLAQDAQNPTNQYVAGDLQQAASELQALGNTQLANYCLQDAALITGSSSGPGTVSGGGSSPSGSTTSTTGTSVSGGSLTFTCTPGGGGVGTSIAVVVQNVDPSTQFVGMALFDGSGNQITVNWTQNASNPAEFDFQIPTAPSGSYQLVWAEFDSSNTMIDEAVGNFTIN